jgi:hypothetical protein
MMAGAASPTYAASIAGGFKSACPDAFVAKGLGPAKFGDQDGYVALASCGSVAAAPYPSCVSKG